VLGKKNFSPIFSKLDVTSLLCRTLHQWESKNSVQSEVKEDPMVRGQGDGGFGGVKRTSSID